MAKQSQNAAWVNIMKGLPEQVQYKAEGLWLRLRLSLRLMLRIWLELAYKLSQQRRQPEPMCLGAFPDK